VRRKGKTFDAKAQRKTMPSLMLDAEHRATSDSSPLIDGRVFLAPAFFASLRFASKI